MRTGLPAGAGTSRPSSKAMPRFPALANIFSGPPRAAAFGPESTPMATFCKEQPDGRRRRPGLGLGASQLLGDVQSASDEGRDE